ncbi:uncharacterized protein LOC130510571 [Raphanus sativus]|uniref:Uncharacterized protein LOC130510571 n=1 Tax=Raphanus sativus TaxID=3726 RepID=A0A9W3DGG3_RAPSA|nr:uncharacterized protein LOC130510571 [Raphanus sativus]
MKDLAKDPNTRVHVDFNSLGEPYGEGSVKLSSYLGPLVREHVPVTLESWKKLTDEVKTMLWKSVQARFEIDDDYQRDALLKHMGALWRSSKSRLVTQINDSENNQQRMKLRPKNVPPVEWRKFVKLKTSQEFKVLSDSYKDRRSKQIPHTCSRKGMVRLAEEMKKNSDNPSGVSRLKIWVKSRTRKDGTPINTNAAEKIQKAAELVNVAKNRDEDTLVQLLGPDNHGRLRVMGRNMSKTKLACFQVKNKTMSEMQEKQIELEETVEHLRAQLAKVQNQVGEENEVGENSAARSVNKKTQKRCLIIDWADEDGNVAEGRIISSDPEDIMNDSRLGPTDVKVFVDSATEPDAYLWRPARNMCTIKEAVGHIIAWPKNKCVELGQGLQPEDIAPLGSKANSLNKCKLLDLSDDSVVVGEGRWQTQEPKALVNGIPLGPKAVKVFLDVILEPQTFLWRPTSDVAYLEDCLMSFISWPARKVVFENPPEGTRNSPTQHTASSVGNIRETVLKVPSISSKFPTSTAPTEKSPSSQLNHGSEAVQVNKKCKLMDISGRKRVVAEGRVHSTDPNQMVHFVRLGPNAARVWVDAVMVDDADVWRKSDEIESLKDAHGSSIAWPVDKLVIF